MNFERVLYNQTNKQTKKQGGWGRTESNGLTDMPGFKLKMSGIQD